jgi:hypothetical protein
MKKLIGFLNYVSLILNLESGISNLEWSSLRSSKPGDRSA